MLNSDGRILVAIAGGLACVLGGNLLAGSARAADQSSSASTPSTGTPSAGDDFTWHGITLYGTVDIGLVYQTHGQPLSDYYTNGLQYLVSKGSNKSILSFGPNGLSQSKVGIMGTEPRARGWSAVFRLEAGFNPTSGDLSDGPRSIAKNNGIALSKQTSSGDFKQSWPGSGGRGLRRVEFNALRHDHLRAAECSDA